MRALVLGGTRFIGRQVVAELAARGHTIDLLHRGVTRSTLPAGVTEHLGDRRVLAREKDRLLALRPEVVIDMCAMTEQDARGLVDVFAGSRVRCVVISSADVYRARDRLCRAQPGPPDPVPLNEDSPLRELRFPYRAEAKTPGDGLYDYDKIPVEELTRRELDATVLRLPAVYGPDDYRHRVEETLMKLLFAGDDRTLRLDAGFAAWRWTRGSVVDVAHAIVLAALDPRATGRTYNVGEEEALSEQEWAEAIGRALPWPGGRVVGVPRETLPADQAAEAATLDYAQDWVLDTTRIRQELGFHEIADRHELLRATIARELETLPDRVKRA